MAKLEAKLNSWTHRSLSLSGHVLLIKTILLSLPLYLFSILVTKLKFIKKIRDLQHKFMWGGPQKRINGNWWLWDTLCKPKSRGGIGIRDSQASNKKLVMKLWWRWIKSPKALWEKMWRNKYIPRIPQQ
jgi:hypothetical protein